MKSVPLSVFPRTLLQRNAAKKVRSAGRIPAVIYGRHHPPQTLEVVSVDFEKLVHHAVSENILVDLEVKEDTRAKRLALVQEVQHHALSGKVLHVDFHEVAENEKVTLFVPVKGVGEAAGVKNGGLLEHIMFKIKVLALPKDLPEVIEVDVAHLEIGQAIHIGDITPPPGVEIPGDKKLVVIAVAAPVTEAEEAAETAAADEAAAEPEVITEKKEEGEVTEGGTEKGKAPAEKGKAPAEKGKAPAEKGKAAPAEKAPEKKAEKKK